MNNGLLQSLLSEQWSYARYAQPVKRTADADATAYGANNAVYDTNTNKCIVR
jgi:hypothetical protein